MSPLLNMAFRARLIACLIASEIAPSDSGINSSWDCNPHRTYQSEQSYGFIYVIHFYSKCICQQKSIQ